jgi:hypothetical protein
MIEIGTTSEKRWIFRVFNPYSTRTASVLHPYIRLVLSGPVAPAIAGSRSRHQA